MSLNGKRGDFTLEDFDACGRTASLPRGRAARIVAEVTEVVSGWATYARRAKVDDGRLSRIARTLRLSLPAR